MLSFRRERGKIPKAPELLTPAKVAEIIQAAHDDRPEFALIIRHLATYGCRPIELCRLDVGDLDAQAGTLTLRDTKNGETVAHPLLPEHVQDLAQLTTDRASSEPLFRNRRGKRWTIGAGGSANELITWYRRLVEDLLTPNRRGIYLLKDYAISRMDAAGIDDRTKALFTGHRDLRSYGRYKATNHDEALAALAKIAGKAPPEPRGTTRGSARGTVITGQDFAPVEILPSESISYESA